MRRLIIRRVLQTIPVLFAVSVLVFGMTQLIPGDAARVVAGENATNEQVAETRAALGLDRPMAVQYWDWLTSALTGDLGQSMSTSEPVRDALAARLPITLLIVVGAMLLSVLLGTLMGSWSANSHGRFPDQQLRALASVLVAIPSFIVGLYLVWIFAINLGWFPATGFQPLSEGLLLMLASIALPAIALGAGGAGEVALQARSAVRSSLVADYTTALKLRGVSTSRVIFKHGARNASIPMTTVIALLFQHLLGAVVIVEVLFALPGIGTLSVDAVRNRDIPMLQGITLVMAVMVLAANLVSDILYGILDPRMRA